MCRNWGFCLRLMARGAHPAEVSPRPLCLYKQGQQFGLVWRREGKGGRGGGGEKTTQLGKDDAGGVLAERFDHERVDHLVPRLCCCCC